MIMGELYNIAPSAELIKIAKHYGINHQKLKLIEEMAELTQALIKGNTSSIVEEMADVQILLDQLRYLYFSPEKNKPLMWSYIAAINYKTKRQQARLAKESN